MKIFWEKDALYKFRPDKKYVVYFLGCFCPPHRGHFSQVRDLVKHRNVRVIVDQIGSSQRHGVPFRLNRKIWKIFIEELLPRERVSLISSESVFDVCDHKFVRDCDFFVIVRGYENDTSRREMEKLIYENTRELRHAIEPRGIKCDVYLTERESVSYLSATELIRKVVKYRNMPMNVKYHKIDYFLPDGLKEETVKFIIKNLERCDLKV